MIPSLSSPHGISSKNVSKPSAWEVLSCFEVHENNWLRQRVWQWRGTHTAQSGVHPKRCSFPPREPNLLSSDGRPSAVMNAKNGFVTCVELTESTESLSVSIRMHTSWWLRAVVHNSHQAHPINDYWHFDRERPTVDGNFCTMNLFPGLPRSSGINPNSSAYCKILYRSTVALQVARCWKETDNDAGPMR